MAQKFEDCYRQNNQISIPAVVDEIKLQTMLSSINLNYS